MTAMYSNCGMNIVSFKKTAQFLLCFFVFTGFLWQCTVCIYGNRLAFYRMKTYPLIITVHFPIGIPELIYEFIENSHIRFFSIKENLDNNTIAVIKKICIWNIINRWYSKFSC